MKASKIRFVRLSVPFRMRGMRSLSFEVAIDPASPSASFGSALSARGPHSNPVPEHARFA
jgi:hypothetical protein